MARDYEREWANLCNAIGDEVASLTDEEILAEAREQGLDPAVEAEHLRRVLQARLISREQTQRQEAR